MTIYKAYDIRGRYPDEINEDIAYKIGRGLVVFTKTKDIMIGIDARPHSPRLRDAFIRGALDQGADVTDIGLITTCQMIALKTWKNHETAVMVTASHLDTPFNGFKMLTGNGQYISEGYGMRDVEVIVQKNEFPAALRKGVRAQANYLDTYVTNLLNLFTLTKPNGVFVADCSNGSIGSELEQISQRTGIQLHIINGTPDGTFPNHSPNPIKPEAQQQAATAIRELHAIGGCIFDADADRVTFLDEHGNAIHPNYIACILITAILEKYPGSAIAYDIISSRIVPETIMQHGGKPLRTRVGRASIIDDMMKHNAVFGAETSSHIMFKETAYGEATTLAMLMVMDQLAKTKKPLSALTKQYMKYSLLEETNYTISNADEAMEALAAAFPEAKRDTLDGICLTFPYGWLLGRKSNTEPLLRIRAETDTPQQLEELFKQAENIIKQLGGTLSDH